MEGGEKFQFAIDRGGTFTDIYARCPGGKIRVMKLLSVDPANYPDAPREGIRRILEAVSENMTYCSFHFEVSDLCARGQFNNCAKCIFM
jgi:N-methylhydantoinase A/oxoprolinase/acetone carboxylase beta subunit